MKVEGLIRILAGTVVLTGTTLAWLHSPWWLLVPAVASVNLIQSAFTGFCPPTMILGRLGMLDVDGTIRKPGQGNARGKASCGNGGGCCCG